MPATGKKVLSFLLFLFILNADGFGQNHPKIAKIMKAPDVEEICTLEPTYENEFFYIRANKRLKRAQSANIEVTYLQPSDGAEWAPEAIEAFEYAVRIWESHITSEIPIRIEAHWIELEDENVLASAGPNWVVQLEEGVPNTWYSIAHASAMTGEDLLLTEIDPADPPYDITVSVNASFDNWYFGTEENTPANMFDFVTIILHEIGHGLGFTGSVNADEEDEVAEWGLSSPPEADPDPIIYDQFTEDGYSNSIVNEMIYPNPSAALYDAVTGREGGVFFAGEQSMLINNNVPVPLYAPYPWEEGSSYSHLDPDLYLNTENALMLPQIGFSFALHTPGPVTCGIFNDIGWPLGDGCISMINILSESRIVVEDELVDFNVMNANSTRVLTVNISNEITAEDDLLGRALVDDDGAFSVVDDVQYFNLEPGESDEIQLSFNPENVGTQNAELVIYHNSAEVENPIIIPIVGEALEAEQVVELEQNYPNPFTSQTTIPYAIPERSIVQLDIYNILGEHIQTVVNEDQNPGRYDLTFNSSGLASGAYFYIIQVKGERKSGKLLITK